MSDTPLSCQQLIACLAGASPPGPRHLLDAIKIVKRYLRDHCPSIRVFPSRDPELASVPRVTEEQFLGIVDGLLRHAPDSVARPLHAMRRGADPINGTVFARSEPAKLFNLPVTEWYRLVTGANVALDVWSAKLAAERTARAETAGPPPVPDKQPQPIESLGDRTYRVGGQVLLLEVSEDAVLQPFCQRASKQPHPIGLYKEELKRKSGYDKAPTILSKICKKHPQLAPPSSAPVRRDRAVIRSTS
jgi:hypothetical protein